MNPSQNPSALRSKKIIIETLLRLMEEYPYKEITVKHILLEADVSRKTFYRNFTSKDDVLNTYINTMLHKYIDSIIEQDKYSIIQIIDVIFYFCKENKKLLFILRDNELLYVFLMRLNSFILREHKKIIRYNTEFPNECSGELNKYIIYFNTGAIWNVIIRWIENNMEDSLIDIKKVIINYLSNIKNIDIRDV